MKRITLPMSIVGKTINFSSDYESGACQVQFSESKGKYFILSTSISLLGEAMPERESFGYLSSWIEENRTDKHIVFEIPEFVTITFSVKAIKRTDEHLKAMGVSTIGEMRAIRNERTKPVVIDSIIKCPYSGKFMKNSEAQLVNGIKYHPSLKFAVCKFSGDYFVVPDQGMIYSPVTALKTEYAYMWRTCSLSGENYYNPSLPMVYSYDTGEPSAVPIKQSVLSRDFINVNDVYYPSHTMDKYDYNECRIPFAIIGQYSVCSECGELFLDDSGLDTCPNCRINYDEPIKSYSYKFNLPSKYEEMRYGIEVELECYEDSRYENARSMCDKFSQKIVCKHDGSLDNGFEVVTKPYPYEEILSLGSAIADYADEIGCKAKSSCGVHIHVSREKVSQHSLALLLLVFSEYKDDIEKVAKRSSERWAKIVKKDKSEMKNSERDFITHHARSGRYQAINLENSSTIEFRIFKGTTSGVDIENYLIFVHDVINACNHITVDDIGVLTFDEILNKGK